MSFQKSSSLWCWSVRLGLAGVVVGSAIALGSNTLAQVVPDNTLGRENSVAIATGNNVDTISGGATREANLFHSFQQFSVQIGRTAQFDNGANIQNIITRVTGGSVSNIDGTIAARGTANLFLLNPNGIVFGQNARLNIGGSFIATTANSINFADGTQFSATPGTGAPLLTVSVPLGLQFGTAAGNITNRSGGVGLQVNPERTLGIVGGNVSLDGGNVTARGGRVELGAVAAPAVVGLSTDNNNTLRFSFPSDVTLADISLLNDTLVNVTAGGGGSIAVNARNLNVTAGSRLGAGIGIDRGTVGAVAGDIDINAQGAISIDGQNQQGLSSGFFNIVAEGGTGNSGNINITARSLSLTNRAQLFTATLGQGNAGSIQVDVKDDISISGGSYLLADSFSTGNAGNVSITSGGSVSFDGDSSGIFTSLSSIPAFQGDRRGGNINVRARSLSLTNGAQLSTTTLGQGDAGNIQIDTTDSVIVNSGADLITSSSGAGNAGSITITSGDRVVFDGVGTNNLPSGASSFLLRNSEFAGDLKAGDINIKARSLSLTNGGRLNADSDRNAGNINVDVSDTVFIDGRGTNLPSEISSILFSEGRGRGGNINVRARSLSLTNGGRLNTSTFGEGNAGNIQLNLDDSVSISSGSLIAAASFSSGSSGNITIAAGGLVSIDFGSILNSLQQAPFEGERRGGDINIKARSLSVTNGGLIGTTTLGQGDAGDIKVDVTDDVSVSGGSFIQASSYGRGNAGNITINAGDRISLDGAGGISGIISFVGQTGQLQGEGRGGGINIKARSLSLSDGAQIGTSTLGLGNAGNIQIDVTDSVDASGGSSIQAISTGEGNAGNITISAGDSVAFDGVGTNGFSSGAYSSVEENALRGDRQAGNINVKARSLFLTNNGQLGSNSLGPGSAGNINVDVRSLNLDDGGIFAVTNSGNGGNIQLRASESLRLRNSSRISTTAGLAQLAGDGGNITIDTPLIIANSNGNNDITANAFLGSGGRVDITADSIFGLTPRSRQELQALLGTDDPTQLDPDRLFSNDITAISQTNPSLSGTVSFNAADINPSSDLVELPTTLVDASSLVAAGCPSGAENRFVVTGGGGLPPAPGDKLSVDAVLTNWATLQTPKTSEAMDKSTPEAVNTTPTILVEANTWQFSSKGEIVLTANASNTPNNFGATPTSCSGF